MLYSGRTVYPFRINGIPSTNGGVSVNMRLETLIASAPKDLVGLATWLCIPTENINHMDLAKMVCWQLNPYQNLHTLMELSTSQ
jgi:hypothetical protein